MLFGKKDYTIDTLKNVSKGYESNIRGDWGDFFKSVEPVAGKADGDDFHASFIWPVDHNLSAYHRMEFSDMIGYAIVRGTEHKKMCQADLLEAKGGAFKVKWNNFIDTSRVLEVHKYGNSSGTMILISEFGDRTYAIIGYKGMSFGTLEEWGTRKLNRDRLTTNRAVIMEVDDSFPGERPLTVQPPEAGGPPRIDAMFREYYTTINNGMPGLGIWSASMEISGDRESPMILPAANSIREAMERVVSDSRKRVEDARKRAGEEELRERLLDNVMQLPAYQLFALPEIIEDFSAGSR